MKGKTPIAIRLTLDQFRRVEAEARAERTTIAERVRQRILSGEVPLATAELRPVHVLLDDRELAAARALAERFGLGLGELLRDLAGAR